MLAYFILKWYIEVLAEGIKAEPAIFYQAEKQGLDSETAKASKT